MSLINLSRREFLELAAGVATVLLSEGCVQPNLSSGSESSTSNNQTLSKPIEIYERPFAINGDTLLMSPDGIFDKTKGIQRIGVYYTPTSDLTSFSGDNQIRYEVKVPSESGIRILGTSKGDLNIIEGADELEFQYRILKQEVPVLRFILADLSNARVGKHKLLFRALALQIAESGGGASMIYRPDWDIEREIFVAETRFDYENQMFSVDVPEGILQLQFLSASIWTNDENWHKKTLLLDSPNGFMITPLFSLNSPSAKWEDELQQNIVPADLRAEFIRNGYALGNDVRIQEGRNHFWRVLDKTNEYILQFIWGYKTLNIYGSVIESPPLVFPKTITVTMTPRNPFTGTHAPLPFQDPLWKIVAGIALLVLTAAAIYAGRKSQSGVLILSPVFDENGNIKEYRNDVPKVECKNTGEGIICTATYDGQGPRSMWETIHDGLGIAASVAGGLYTSMVVAALQNTASIAALSEPIDPFREGEANTSPNSNEMTTREVVTATFNYTDKPIYSSDPFGIEVDWNFQRITTDGISEKVYAYVPETWKTQPMVKAECVVELEGDIQDTIQLDLDGKLQTVPIFGEESEVSISTYLKSLISNEAVSGSNAYVTAIAFGPNAQPKLVVLIDKDNVGKYTTSIFLEHGMHAPLFTLAYKNSYENSLNQGVLSSDLQKEFEVHGITFSSSINISKAEVGERSWQLSDEQQTNWIVIDEDKDKLKIYESYSIWRVTVFSQAINKAKRGDDPIKAAAHIGGITMNPILSRSDSATCSTVTQALFGITKKTFYKKS